MCKEQGDCWIAGLQASWLTWWCTSGAEWIASPILSLPVCSRPCDKPVSLMGEVCKVQIISVHIPAPAYIPLAKMQPNWGTDLCLCLCLVLGIPGLAQESQAPVVHRKGNEGGVGLEQCPVTCQQDLSTQKYLRGSGTIVIQGIRYWGNYSWTSLVQ